MSKESKSSVPSILKPSLPKYTPSIPQVYPKYTPVYPQYTPSIPQLYPSITPVDRDYTP